MARAHGWVLLVALLAVSAGAQAQDWEEEGDDEAAEEEGSDEGGPDGEVDVAGGDPDAAGKAAGDEEAGGKPEFADRTWSFGPYVRFTWVPAFIQNIFLDEAPNVFNPGFGVTANMRGETSTVVLGIGYQSYAFADAMRKNGGEPNDTEWADSDLGLLHVSGSILWRAELADKLELDYGIGLDFGVVLGKLIRTEAYENAAGEWAKCDSVGVPDPFFCRPPQVNLVGTTDPYDVDGEQYGVEEEDIPPVFAFPMIPQLRLRYALLPELAPQLELAYGIAQFWFGFSVVYAPDM